MSNEVYFDPAVAVAQLDAAEEKEIKKAKRKTLMQIIKYAICTASAGLIEFITFTSSPRRPSSRRSRMRKCGSSPRTT